MKTIDRVILGTLAAGIWAVALSHVLLPYEANALQSYEIDDFKRAVIRIVENCDVYVYDIDGGEGYGEISC